MWSLAIKKQLQNILRHDLSAAESCNTNSHGDSINLATEQVQNKCRTVAFLTQPQHGVSFKLQIFPVPVTRYRTSLSHSTLEQSLPFLCPQVLKLWFAAWRAWDLAMTLIFLSICAITHLLLTSGRGQILEFEKEGVGNAIGAAGVVATVAPTSLWADLAAATVAAQDWRPWSR